MSSSLKYIKIKFDSASCTIFLKLFRFKNRSITLILYYGVYEQNINLIHPFKEIWNHWLRFYNVRILLIAYRRVLGVNCYLLVWKFSRNIRALQYFNNTFRVFNLNYTLHIQRIYKYIHKRSLFHHFYREESEDDCDYPVWRQ